MKKRKKIKKKIKKNFGFKIQKIKNLKLFLILALTIVAVYFVQEYRYKPSSLGVTSEGEKLNDQKTPELLKYTPETVPELKEILSPDNQEVRLKAGRKLVERVDVEQALEILEHSDLPHTGEGHLVVHQIGFYAYQKYGIDAILKCKDYFLYACYHGAIIEAASNQGFDVIKKMTDICKESPVRHFQCVHAAGHAIMAIWNYDLKEALKTCDQIYESDKQFPEALSSCHNGAFMENLFGVHDWGTGKAQKRDWLSDDPYFPCNAFGEKYQKGCWLNQAARIYQMNSSDVSKTSEICQKVENKQYVDWCMDNLARQIHPLTQGDPSKAFELCQKVGPKFYDNCIVVNAGSFYSVGGRDQAIFICQNVPPNLKSECYQRVIGQIASDPIEKAQKQDLCQKIEMPFRNQCSSALAPLN